MAGPSENIVEVVGCGLNDQGELIAKYHEISNEGMLAAGQSCAVTIAGFGKFSVRRPTPVPKTEETSDPGCLIWDLAGGTIGQNN